MYEDIYASIRYAAQKRNLRESTIDLYCNDTRYFLRCTGKEIADLTIEDVDAFLTIKRLEGISPETYNHYHSAIRFFYKKILKLNWDDEDIPRMKLNRSLPTVLSREEISAIIDATKNLKHKAMITTMYSSGLRVSEVIHLHYDDISRTNMTIHVRNTKSRRDRYTILSQKNLDLLTEYWFKKGRPKGILFPNQFTGQYLTVSTLEQVIRRSAAAAGLSGVTPHCLRHSFATHLMEQGVEQRNIQALLGHRDPKSTEVYLHVSNKSLMGIRSPFDRKDGTANG